MAAFRHVPNRPALEIPVVEPRNLFQKCNPEASLQMPAQPEETSGHPKFDKQPDAGNEHKEANRQKALLDEPQVASQIDDTTQEHGLPDGAARGQQQADEQENKDQISFQTEHSEKRF